MIQTFDFLFAPFHVEVNNIITSVQAVGNSLFSDVLNYIIRRNDIVLNLFYEHLWIVFISIVIAIGISVTLGILISYYSGPAQTVLTVSQVLMTIPSIAMLGIMVPLLGIGFKTGVTALILYCLLPIIRNTYTGIKEISPSIVESAVGMGMTEWRILTKIKIPLAMPVIIAGIRMAIVMIVGIAAVTAYVGAGGLGELIFQGISRSSKPMIITGALGVSVIAITLDIFLSWGERRLLSIGKSKGE